MTLRDRAALEDILSYCERTQSYLNRSGNSPEAFRQDTMLQDACCMCIVQIGELVGLLSDEAKQAMPQIPWRSIKETRNFYVHNYGHINVSYVWATLREDLPQLMEVCAAMLSDAE